MLNIRFSHPEYGDMEEKMSAEQAAMFIQKNRKKISVASFSELDEPLELPEKPFLDTAELVKKLKEKDGQELVLYPAIGGG